MTATAAPSRRRLVRRALIATAVLAVVVLAAGVRWIVRSAPVGTGFAAKTMCSSVFVSGRDPADVAASDLEPVAGFGIAAVVDRERRTATASIGGLFHRTAVYRDGLGCTLAVGRSVAELEQQAVTMPAARSAPDAPWPEGERVEAVGGVVRARLDAALEEAFAEPDPDDPRRTRAVIVVHGGRIVAERYASGFGGATPLLGWSMTKSVTGALIGILVGQGLLEPDRPAPVPEWRDPSDPRRAITLEQLLQMAGGLDFEELYETKLASAVNRMLFSVLDGAAFAAARPLAFPPGTRWQYSSGTTAILSRIVRQTAPGEGRTFARRELFDRIGMTTAVLEEDPSGTISGSSFMYAGARDWARFGLLYLHDGLWAGERVLPAGWVEASTTPTTAATPDGVSYGYQLWLNRSSPAGSGLRWMPWLPEDAFACRGHESQFVVVIPSRDLVVVRLGRARGSSNEQHIRFIERVLEALP